MPDDPTMAERALNVDSVRNEMVRELDTALHGRSVARPSAPVDVWAALIAEVRDLVRIMSTPFRGQTALPDPAPTIKTPPPTPPPLLPSRFVLIRDEDPTGVSGVGTVAEGIEFSDGTVALRWLVPADQPGHGFPTSVVFHDRGMESVERIHGHGGRTRIVRIDEKDPSDGP